MSEFIINSEPYPEGVGKVIVKHLYEKSKIPRLVDNLPDDVIIRVYGLAGVGKGTLSRSLSQILDIPHVEGSFILRAATYAYEDMSLELNKENTRKVFEKISPIIGEDNDLQMVYNGKVLERSDLKNSFIDTHVTKYSGDVDVREAYYAKLGHFLSFGVEGPCIVDSRGGMPPYIENAIINGKHVIQILLKVDDTEAFERYYESVLESKQKHNPEYKDNDLHRAEALAQFKLDVVERNELDVVMMKKMGLGLITPDTGVLDTSDCNVDEMIGSTLNYISDEIF